MHLLLAWVALLLLALPAEANHDEGKGLHIIQDVADCKFTTGKFGAQCVPIFIGHLIQVILGFVGAFCLINIMIGGYSIALGSAMGDKEAGKNRVIWALAGLFVSLISYGLINLIVSTLGL